MHPCDMCEHAESVYHFDGKTEKKWYECGLLKKEVRFSGGNVGSKCELYEKRKDYR